MSREPVIASLESVRRLAVTKQHLAGKLPARATTGAMPLGSHGKAVRWSRL